MVATGRPQRAVAHAELACYARGDAAARKAHCSGDVCRWEKLLASYERHLKRGTEPIANHIANCSASPAGGEASLPPVVPLFTRSATPLRVLFVEDFFPHGRAAWRLNEARAFVERYETGTWNTAMHIISPLAQRTGSNSS